MKIEAPERIWADAKTCTVYMDGSSPIVARDREFRNSTEYVRADLYAKLVAENERLTACRDFWKERFQVETRVRIEAEALSRTGAVKVLEGRLSEEHKRLSDLFVHYNTPGLGAPGFAQDICKRLTSLEESMLKCTRPSEQAVTTVAEAIRAAVSTIRAKHLHLWN